MKYKHVNYDKLKEARAFLSTIPSEMINMAHYRKGDESIHVCNSIGCAIGHLTALIPKEELPIYVNKEINFSMVSKILFNINNRGSLWDFLFSANWDMYDSNVDQKEHY